MNQLLRTTRIPLGFFLLFSCCLIRVDASPAPPSPKDAYSHDAKGLEKQYEAFLKALAKRDAAAMNEAYKIFFIPEPDRWFATYFKKEDVEQLGWDQEAENENEEKSLVTITNLVGRGSRFHAHCSPPSHDPQSRLAPKTNAIAPLLPQIEAGGRIRCGQRKEVFDSGQLRLRGWRFPLRGKGSLSLLVHARHHRAKTLTCMLTRCHFEPA